MQLHASAHNLRATSMHVPIWINKGKQSHFLSEGLILEIGNPDA